MTISLHTMPATDPMPARPVWRRPGCPRRLCAPPRLASRRAARSPCPRSAGLVPGVSCSGSSFSALPHFDYFEFPEFKEKLKSRLSNVKGLVSSSLDFDFSSPLSYVPTLSARLRSLHAHLAAELPCFEFDAPPLLRELLRCVPRGRGCVPGGVAVAPSLPASISLVLPPAPRSPPCPSSTTAMHAADEGASEEESGPTPADALRRADFGRKLIGYEDLPLEWRNNPWVVEGYRFIPLTRWPALVRSVFTLHNESLNIQPISCRWFCGGGVLGGWGAVFLKPLARGSRCRTRGAEVGSEDWARYTVFGVPNPTPDARVLFTLFALACLACRRLWHTMAGVRTAGRWRRVRGWIMSGLGGLIATSIATVVHPRVRLRRAGRRRDASGTQHPPPQHAPPLGAVGGAAREGGGRGAGAHAPVYAPARCGEGCGERKWVDGVEARMSATSNATSSLAAWPAYHPVGAGCLCCARRRACRGTCSRFAIGLMGGESALAPRLLRGHILLGTRAARGYRGGAGVGYDDSVCCPVGPSLLYYIVGLVAYATQVPERFLGGRGGWVGWVSDMCGGELGFGEEKAQ
ncbi:hypothetical protein B0H13DRAFT_2554181 [Mycena leptocephala]|nr:hypothetical protein B0H13DRAFT_2554181 [Mycena leptocephala]